MKQQVQNIAFVVGIQWRKYSILCVSCNFFYMAILMVNVARSLVFCVMFCRSLFYLFGHCIVCSSSIYGFWLPIWYLQTFL